MRAILVGGENARRTLEVPEELRTLVMPIYKRVNPRYPPAEPSADRPSAEFYIRHGLRGSSQRFEAFALEGMTGDDVMAALIEGYAKPTEVQP